MEKVFEHPEYHTLSPAEKNQFNSKIKDVFPKTETLKKKLLQIFQEEHELYEEEMASNSKPQSVSQFLK